MCGCNYVNGTRCQLQKVKGFIWVSGKNKRERQRRGCGTAGLISRLYVLKMCFCQIYLNPSFKSTNRFKVKATLPSSRSVKEGRVFQTQKLSLPDDIFNTMSTRREPNFFHMGPSHDTEGTGRGVRVRGEDDDGDEECFRRMALWQFYAAKGANESEARTGAHSECGSCYEPFCQDSLIAAKLKRDVNEPFFCL